MEENFGGEESDNIVILNDEDGNEVKFEFLDLIPLDEEEYVVLLPVSEEGEEEEGEVVILKVEDTDEETDEESYISVEDEETLNICKNNRSYTIKPNLVVDNNPLIAIKQNITNGSIISLKINNQLNNELPLIIEYIHSKDLKIVTLSDLLNE